MISDEQLQTIIDVLNRPLATWPGTDVNEVNQPSARNARLQRAGYYR
jgi:hypothetical protein